MNWDDHDTICEITFKFITCIIKVIRDINGNRESVFLSIIKLYQKI